MNKTITLPFHQDIQIRLPDSLDLISTYVLQEQQDWFEDEIHFVRHLLRPGQKALDIGANYGLFSLSMARCVGSSGRVWSIEPASGTAALLKQSVALNGFDQVKVLQLALSDRLGTARLALNDNAELNELIRDANTQVPSEEVPLSTLDTLMDQHDWQGIDFVKMDAEGEEAAIVRGGRRFLEQNSPLVQFEVKAGTQINDSLIQVFEAIGYQVYRLIPGLHVLQALEPGQVLDSFQLNLFCCKPDRAEDLARRGLLLLPGQALPTQQARELAASFARSGQDRLHALPYGQALSAIWERSREAPGHARAVEALALHQLAHAPDQATGVRVAALNASLQILTDIANEQPQLMHHASLARVARELGERKRSNRALETAWHRIQQTREINLSLPFLTPVPESETVEPAGAVDLWSICSLLEGLERGLGYSSFFMGQESLERLEALRQLGLGSPQMQRRLDLMLRRHGLTQPAA